MLSVLCALCSVCSVPSSSLFRVATLNSETTTERRSDHGRLLVEDDAGRLLGKFHDFRVVGLLPE